MALFFFHFFDGRERCDDDSGLELPSAEAAYLEAVATAQGMWAELLATGHNPSLCAFEIANDQGETLFRLEFVELLESLPAPGFRDACHTAGLVQTLRGTHHRASVARAGVMASLDAVKRTVLESNDLLSQLAAFETVCVPPSRA